MGGAGGIRSPSRSRFLVCLLVTLARLEGESLRCCVWQLVAKLRLVVRVDAESEQPSLLVPVSVVSEAAIVELVVLPVELGVGEDAGQHQIVSEVRPLLQVAVDVRKTLAEALHDHRSILLSYDLVPCTTCQEDVLLANCFDLADDLAALGLKDRFEDSDWLVDQVGERLL